MQVTAHRPITKDRIAVGKIDIINDVRKDVDQNKAKKKTWTINNVNNLSRVNTRPQLLKGWIALPAG